jgi:hypothetical protein
VGHFRRIRINYLEEPKNPDTSELDNPVTSFPALSLTPNTNVYPNRDRFDKLEEEDDDAVPEQEDPAP